MVRVILSDGICGARLSTVFCERKTGRFFRCVTSYRQVEFET